MKKRVVWLVMSCVMVAVLVLSSCTSAVTEEEEVVTEEEEVVTEGVELSGEALQAALTTGKVVETEKPIYGGEINIGVNHVQSGFDDGLAAQNNMDTVLLSNDELMVGDWTAGPAGSGETHFRMHYNLNPKYWVGQLAESWEIIDGTTLIYHLREGVMYHDPALNPDNEAMALVNGREFVAADCVYNWERHWANPATYIYHAAPRDTDIVSVTAPDKYTAVIEATAPDRLTYPWELCGGWTLMYPPEVIEEYGDMTDWRNSVGTGPYYLTDYIDGSAATMKRNPNWYMTNPIGPGEGDQVPYLDGVNFFYMVDVSTRLAALRTGKVDFLSAVSWEDADLFMSTSPELKYTSNFPFSGNGISFRMDNPDFVGYNDERGQKVRRALAMAIDQPTMAKEYYGGHATLLYFLIGKEAQFASVRTEIEDLPMSADGFDNKKMFGYYPEEAGLLLDEAGYPGPERMKLELPVWSNTQIDIMSLVKAYWEDIGVELELVTMEYGAYTSMSSAKTFEDLFIPLILGTFPFNMINIRWGDNSNVSMLNDPYLQDSYYTMMGDYFDWDKRLPILKDVNEYLIDLGVVVQLPTPEEFSFWQPWVKNFHGELVLGDADYHNFTNFCWIDQDLKEELTGN
ncbi:ABC transporter substrate-binding protein [Chloroflexota bacterium]